MTHTTRRQFVQWTGFGVGAAAVAPVSSVFAAVGADSLIVVSNAGASDSPASMSLIHPESLEVLVTLPAPGAFAFPATRWAYARDIVWGAYGERVVGISLTTGEEVAGIETASRQNYTEVTPDGRFVIAAARYQHKVLRIDAAADTPDLGRVDGEVALYDGAQPCDMTILADGSMCFTPDRGGETVSVFGIDPFRHVVTVPLERMGEESLEPYMATVSPRADLLFVENARGTGSESIMDVRNPERPVEIRRLTQADGLGVNPLTSEFTPDGRYNLIICRNSSELTIVDCDSIEVVGSVAFPDESNPIAGTFTPEGNRMFVPLPGRDSVAVVAVPAFEVEALIPVGARPLGAAYVENPMPERLGLNIPLGTALETGRVFPENCPDRCCGPV